MKTIFRIPLLLIIFFWLTNVNCQESAKEFIIVLDAGHGGKDPGKNPKHGANEKTIALDITLLLGEALEKHTEFKIIYTRKTDVFIPLRKRASIANKADADLFVSIHCNAHTTANPYGTETYVLGLHANQANFNVAKSENEVIFLEEDFEENYDGFDPNSPESLIGLTMLQEDYLDQSILVARYIQDNFKTQLKRKDRGVKQAGFWVLHNTYMPSILIETGFVTNTEESNYLNSNRGKKNIANSIYESIVKYYSNLNSVYAAQDDLVANDSKKNQETPQTAASSDPLFKIQIAASSKDIALMSYNFNGLDQLSVENYSGIYRYFYGSTGDYERAKELQKIAVTKGYKDAYMVAFKNGEKISIAEAIKSNLK